MAKLYKVYLLVDNLHNRYSVTVLLATVLCLLFVGCSTPMPTPVPVDKPSLLEVGVVRGVLVTKSTGQSVSGERVLLATFEEIGGQIRVFYEFEKGEPVCCSAYTDKTGAFTIEAPPDIYVIVSPGGSTNDKIVRVSDTVLKIKVQAGQTIDVGRVLLP